MGSRDKVYESVSSLVVIPLDRKGGNDYDPKEIRFEELQHANAYCRAYDCATIATSGRLAPPS